MGSLSPVAIVVAVATVIWGFIQLPWYVPIPLFAIAGILFGLIHGAFARASPISYLGFFPAYGALLGSALMMGTQALLWLQ